MKSAVMMVSLSAGLLAGGSGFATGLATCDSGPRETWQPQEKLEKMLVARGWRVNRVKEDGGCYEVYAINEKGQRVEAYFHPKTLEPVPTQPRR